MRDVKSENNAKSRFEDSFLKNDASSNSIYFKNNKFDGSISEKSEENSPENIEGLVKYSINSRNRLRIHKSAEVEPDEEISQMSSSDSSKPDPTNLPSRKDERTYSEHIFIEEEKESYNDEQSEEEVTDNDDINADAEGENTDEDDKSGNDSSEAEGESEESYESDNKNDIEEEHKEELKVYVTEFTNSDENHKHAEFQSYEEDEISGGRLPSEKVNHMSSTMHEISIAHENRHEVNSNVLSARKENPVGVPRRSTVVNDGKVWSIEEDGILLKVVEK